MDHPPSQDFCPHVFQFCFDTCDKKDVIHCEAVYDCDLDPWNLDQGLFGGGILGDRYNPRVVLSIGMWLSAIVVELVSLEGMQKLSQLLLGSLMIICTAACLAPLLWREIIWRRRVLYNVLSSDQEDNGNEEDEVVSTEEDVVRRRLLAAEDQQ
ncbi:hypothetical protein TELCIR_17522 [Teladorsagia circumcincta]|uniref:Uncharacterized protein n=1 Tax=Teladorsagia circumcincta TaxID=45464 RepID=A0A2G9TSJ4_TELCI|nr:hypothetical protein TELCIR_17522 [Teladorsagia circumcincta]